MADGNMSEQTKPTPELQTKSISEMHKRFCETWRRQRTDDQFLELLRDITAGEYLTNSMDGALTRPNSNLNQLRVLLNAHVGDECYAINNDTVYRLVP
jgi:hypothetical protein